MDKTTQKIEQVRIAEPLRICYNSEAKWFSVAFLRGDGQPIEAVFPFQYRNALAFGLWQIPIPPSEDDSPTRSADIEADWQAANLLMKRE